MKSLRRLREWMENDMNGGGTRSAGKKPSARDRHRARAKVNRDRRRNNGRN